jgi:predicted aldo/keto reductase-like oxidoreductase
MRRSLHQYLTVTGGHIMEYRFLGASGFKVPALSFGAGTFGGKGPLFSAWGRTDAAEATRLVDICLDAGVNMFDTADVYSDGQSGSADRPLVASSSRQHFRQHRGQAHHHVQRSGEHAILTPLLRTRSADRLRTL